MKEIIIILTIILITTILMIINNVFGVLNEKTYLTTSFMYIVSSILITIICSLIINEYKLLNNVNIIQITGTLILSIISLFTILFTTDKQQILKHIGLIIFLLSTSVSLYYVVKDMAIKNILFKILLVWVIIVTLLILFAYIKPLNYFDSLQPYLFIGLFSLVIVQLFDIIILKPKNIRTLDKIYGWLVIIIFSGYILSDTQRILKMAKLFTKSNKTGVKHLESANYPSSIIGMFLNLLNMFSGLGRIN